MPSPFPGMDPYLEGDLWPEFHATLTHAIRAQLLLRLTPKYVALLAKRYVRDRSAEATVVRGSGGITTPTLEFPVSWTCRRWASRSATWRSAGW